MNSNFLLSGIFSLLLIILQITFGFLMQKHKEAFLKYHRVLGVVIFFVALLNVLLLPTVTIIGIITLLAIIIQITLGIILMVTKNEKIKNFHRPLGISIAILIIANLVLALI